MTYLVLKFLHVIGATVILGTGVGIAFFMLVAHRTGDSIFIARTARVVVLADFLFTATAVLLQPITGVLLMAELSIPFEASWIGLSIVLYIVAGAFWVPVVLMQRRMRDLAGEAVAAGQTLPEEYHWLFRRWFWFGFPGFGSVVAIMWLMIAKPEW